MGGKPYVSMRMYESEASEMIWQLLYACIGASGNIGAGRCAVIQFFFQQVNLRFPYSGLIGEGQPIKPRRPDRGDAR